MKTKDLLESTCLPFDHSRLSNAAALSLFEWFEGNARDLPWRRTRDPFLVLIAEKLLQQTAVGTALVDAFNTFVEKYPTPLALMDARLCDIEQIIRKLGFRYRAAEMIKMSTEIAKRHGGQVPEDHLSLLRLTGVGEYCSRAVQCFAFQKHVAIVDTNVARFLKRFYGCPGPLPSNPARSKFLITFQQRLLPKGKARSFQLALLDLTAKICRPTNPGCPLCPLRKFCASASQHPNQVLGRAKAGTKRQELQEQGREGK